MNSTDGVNQAPKLTSELRGGSVRQDEVRKFPKSVEDYVMIENRLAAQRQNPQPNPQLNSIFDELRGRLPK